MSEYRKMEFYITPNGKVMVDEEGSEPTREYTQSDRNLSRYLLEIIAVQYPEALEALSGLYSQSKPNAPYYDYLRVHRFIRCNFGKFDGLTYDVEGRVMHLEDVSCPIKCECPLHGIVCKPKPFGLTNREAEIATLSVNGFTYKEISAKLGIAPSTIKNLLQKIKDKLKLTSTKDIAKLFVAIL